MGAVETAAAETAAQGGHKTVAAAVLAGHRREGVAAQAFQGRTVVATVVARTAAGQAGRREGLAVAAASAGVEGRATAAAALGCPALRASACGGSVV